MSALSSLQPAVIDTTICAFHLWRICNWGYHNTAPSGISFPVSSSQGVAPYLVKKFCMARLIPALPGGALQPRQNLQNFLKQIHLLSTSFIAFVILNILFYYLSSYLISNCPRKIAILPKLSTP